MRPIDHAPREVLEGVHALLFDLDDTVLTHGRLTRDAYDALCDLAGSHLPLVAVTGRPAGWGEVLARQWPILGVVSENGAVSSWREGSAIHRSLRGSEPYRDRALALVQSLQREIPELVLADDNPARVTDVTVDVGEREKVAPATIARARTFVHAHGARTILSSVHLHVTFEGDDKASGVLRFLRERLGWDAGTALGRAAFVGDSENDSACFSAFQTTFGVANVAPWVQRLSVPPRFVARGAMGEGFAEIARALLAVRPST